MLESHGCAVEHDHSEACDGYDEALPFNVQNNACTRVEQALCQSVFLLFEPTVRYIYWLLLKEEGFDVLEASDGVEVLQIALQQQPDLVILDLNMPEMNRLECARELRKFSQISIVMITAYGNRDSMSAALRSGIDYYINKPSYIEELLACIRTLLRRVFASRHHDIISPYEWIERIATSTRDALLAVSIEAPERLLDELVEARAVVIPYATASSTINNNPAHLIARVPVELVEKSIQHMLAIFFDHPAVRKNPDVTLNYGYAAGPCASADELIERVAQDCVKRYRIRTSDQHYQYYVPAILNLQSDRWGLERRHRIASLEYEDMRRRPRTQAGLTRVQTEIGRLTAIVNHDLRGAMAGSERLYSSLTHRSGSLIVGGIEQPV